MPTPRSDGNDTLPKSPISAISTVVSNFLTSQKTRYTQGVDKKKRNSEFHGDYELQCFATCQDLQTRLGGRAVVDVLPVEKRETPHKL